MLPITIIIFSKVLENDRVINGKGKVGKKLSFFKNLHNRV